MPHSSHFSRLAAGLLFAALALDVAAHGDVTPHPVDTSSLKPIGSEWVIPSPYRGNVQAAVVGADGYLHNCAGCHGLNAVSGGVAPDLLKATLECLDMASASAQASCMKDGDEFFRDITLAGKKTSEGRYTMPPYNEVFTQEAVWAVKAYIDARAAEEKAKKGR